MIFDLTTMFSNAQAITADAASTDVLDLGVVGRVYGAAADLTKDIGKGNCIPILIQVVETFNTLTSLTIALQTDDADTFGSAKTVWSAVVALADLKAGKVIVPEFIPRGTDERFMRLYYTVTGTAPTLGKITAGVTMGNQSNG